jgi:hypothetical protein
MAMFSATITSSNTTLTAKQVAILLFIVCSQNHACFK